MYTDKASQVNPQKPAIGVKPRVFRKKKTNFTEPFRFLVTEKARKLIALVGAMLSVTLGYGSPSKLEKHGKL